VRIITAGVYSRDNKVFNNPMADMRC
jgi:hypothetical protein